MIGIIYKLTSPSGKVYIGQTIKPKTRKASFYNRNNYYSGTKMDNAIKKYGPENFKYDILSNVEAETKEELRMLLDPLEIFYIKKFDSYRNGYNMTEGGSGSKGCFQTEESKMKIRMAAIGRSSPMKGRKLSDRQKALLSKLASSRTGDKNPFYGRHHSEETKSKIGSANGKAVLQIDPINNEIINEFDSARLAAICFGKPRANSEIVKVCRCYKSPSGKNYKTALGYKWKYKESSTTIPKGSTLQANGSGNGELLTC